MLGRAVRVISLGLLGPGLVVWWLTHPQTVDAANLSYTDPDLADGELLFHASSCAACHEDDLRGGLEL